MCSLRKPSVMSCADALAADGHVQGQDLYYYVAQGAGHTESAWAAGASSVRASVKRSRIPSAASSLALSRSNTATRSSPAAPTSSPRGMPPCRTRACT